VSIYDDDWSSTVAWQNSQKNEILYCGYRFDVETGFYHVRNRMYHPTLGSWASRDVLRYVDGMCLYEYVQSDPVWGLDPLGADTAGKALEVSIGHAIDSLDESQLKHIFSGMNISYYKVGKKLWKTGKDYQDLYYIFNGNESQQWDAWGRLVERHGGDLLEDAIKAGLTKAGVAAGPAAILAALAIDSLKTGNDIGNYIASKAMKGVQHNMCTACMQQYLGNEELGVNRFYYAGRVDSGWGSGKKALCYARRECNGGIPQIQIYAVVVKFKEEGFFTGFLRLVGLADKKLKRELKKCGTAG